MNGLQRVGAVVVIHSDAARVLRDAVLIAARARSCSGLPLSRHYRELAETLHAAVSAPGQSDVPPAPVPDTEGVTPDVPIERAARELGISKRQARRLAPDLGGKLIGGRWLIDRQALNEHIEGRR